MASVTQTIDTYYAGMSHQPDLKKFPGQVKDIQNAIPDIVEGLYKRPGTKRIGTTPLANVQSNGSWFRSRADGGFHYAKGSTPNTTAAAADTFTIEGMRVGIGTVNPNTHSQLHIANGPYAFLTLDSTNTAFPFETS